MCYYDRIRFFCGCQTWSEVRQQCDEAGPPDTSPGCQLRRIRKHIYDPEGRKCHTCLPRSDIETSLSLLRRQREIEQQALLVPSPCPSSGCFLQEGHLPPHVSWTPCSTAACILQSGHDSPHKFVSSGVLSRDLAGQVLSLFAREAIETMHRLNLLVLEAMAVSKVAAEEESREQTLIPRAIPIAVTPAKQRAIKSSATATASEAPYLGLNLRGEQIRLFELLPATETSEVEGRFRRVQSASTLPYTALSYTWGDQTNCQVIRIEGGATIWIGENLWWFLRLQSTVISRPKLFWIDAICINQSSVHERNHQVGLMKRIYATATGVYAWLGLEADNSDLATDFVAKKGARNLRRRGPGFNPLWSREEGKALHALCERSYWRRMWIIQEIIHAEKITVWCGRKSFEWGFFENLYLNLKTLEDTHWYAHHEFASGVLQSSAGVMVWQRAHWRHPETPTPRLQMLIEVFHAWQCTDVRDKVYALVGMASSDTAIVPDYSQSARQVYFAIQEKDADDKAPFYSLLSQALGLPGRELKLPGQDLIEYKSHPPEKLVLRKRVYED